MNETFLSAKLRAYYQQAGAYVRYLYGRGQEYPVWSEERAEYWHRSLLFFVKEFIQPELPMPDFHRDWYRWMVSEPSYINLSSRLHAKTACHSIYRPVWELCCDQMLRFVIAGKKQAIAEDSLSTIKSYFGLERIVAGFGQLNPSKLPPEQRLTEATDWSLNTITVNRDERGQPLRGPSVVAVGALSSVLSIRAERLIADDIVDSMIAESKVQCERLLRWYDGDLLPVLVPREEGGQEIIVGTQYNNRDLYAYKMQLTKEATGEAKHSIYKMFIGDAIVNAKRRQTLWPEKWSYEALMAQRAKMGSVRFNRNYRCQIMGDEDSNFPMIWFTGGKGEDGTYYRGCLDKSLTLGMTLQGVRGYALRTRNRVMGVDPAIAKTKRDSYSAYVVLGTDANGDVPILDIRREKIGFVDQKRLVLALYRRWQVRAIVVEGKAYQDALRQGLQEEEPSLPLVKKTTTQHDTIHIPSMDVYFETGRIRIPYGDAKSREMADVLVEELNLWDRAATSDVLMAFYFGLMRLLKYAPMLAELPNPADLIFGDTQRGLDRGRETTSGVVVPGRTLARIREMVQNAPVAPVREMPLVSTGRIPPLERGRRRVPR